MHKTIDDIICVKCGQGEVVSIEDANTFREIEPNVFRCQACGGFFPRVFGVPFFGDFNSEDILGLIQIAANIEHRGKFSVTPGSVEYWENLLAEYHEAEDKESFTKSLPETDRIYLPNRYGEWLEIKELTKNLDINKLKVLDLGAGTGFDAHRLFLKGADITALEISPILAESGTTNFPEIRWIGGSGSLLPFVSEAFDAVFSNAALHHMRDIPTVIEESLRVLKVGGVLITTSDSFRGNRMADKAEARMFDANVPVLMGINERVPRFSEFIVTLERYREHLDIEMYTHTLYDPPRDVADSPILSGLRKWDFDKDKKMLSKRSGSLALKVTLRSSLRRKCRVQDDSVISVTDFSRAAFQSENAMSFIAQKIPKTLVNLPFPGRLGRLSKFELLNGWRVPHNRHSRVAYRRARWFLSRTNNQSTLGFELQRPKGEKEGLLKVSINKNEVGQIILTDEWKTFSVDVTGYPAGIPFVVECTLEGCGAGLQEASFEVRKRRFFRSTVLSSRLLARLFNAI